MDIDRALYSEPACRIMLLLNTHIVANVGEDKVMTLWDLEDLARKRRGREKHG